MKAEESVRSFQRHLRALLRAELLIAEIKLNALLKKTMLMAVAGVILGLLPLSSGATCRYDLAHDTDDAAVP